MTQARILQIPLDLGHRTALGREDFFISPANADAVAWIDRWPDWPAPVLVVQGPPGCGKSHLAAVWAQRSGAALIGGENLRRKSAEDLAARAEHLALDPAEPVIGDRESETALFHLYNILKEQGRTALVTLRTPPAQMPFVLPDLASRLRAAPLAAIAPPDDELLTAILVKLFDDRQIEIGREALTFALARMERSFAAARALADEADRLALSEKRPISIPLLRRVLENEQMEEKES